MTLEHPYHQLIATDNYWKNRQYIANIILQDTTVLPCLLQLCYRFNDKISCRACWTLELVCRQHLHELFPFLDDFIAKLPRFQFDAAIRPVAKISQLLIKSYFGRNPSPVKNQLTTSHIQQLITVNFDWLIGDEKVAVKAYAIHSLYELGKQHHWIYPELKILLEQTIHTQSAAYKAAARNTLKKLP